MTLVIFIPKRNIPFVASLEVKNNDVGVCALAWKREWETKARERGIIKWFGRHDRPYGFITRCRTAQTYTHTLNFWAPTRRRSTSRPARQCRSFAIKTNLEKSARETFG